MILVGLTGGIGSGKSTVSSMLAARGAEIIDADAITHEVQQQGSPVVKAIAERFGNDVVESWRRSFSRTPRLFRISTGWFIPRSSPRSTAGST
jgi:dephospho-CoA kinase